MTPTDILGLQNSNECPMHLQSHIPTDVAQSITQPINPNLMSTLSIKKASKPPSSSSSWSWSSSSFISFAQRLTSINRCGLALQPETQKPKNDDDVSNVHDCCGGNWSTLWRTEAIYPAEGGQGRLAACHQPPQRNEPSSRWENQTNPPINWVALLVL